MGAHFLGANEEINNNGYAISQILPVINHSNLNNLLLFKKILINLIMNIEKKF